MIRPTGGHVVEWGEVRPSPLPTARAHHIDRARGALPRARSCRGERVVTVTTTGAHGKGARGQERKRVRMIVSIDTRLHLRRDHRRRRDRCLARASVFSPRGHAELLSDLVRRRSPRRGSRVFGCHGRGRGYGARAVHRTAGRFFVTARASRWRGGPAWACVLSTPSARSTETCSRWVTRRREVLLGEVRGRPASSGPEVGTPRRCL